MWAGVVKLLSRFFAFDGVSRGVRGRGRGKRRRGQEKAGKEKAGADNLKRI